jgi:hypothetical protein
VARIDLRAQLRDLEALASRAGLSVRYESLRLPKGARDHSRGGVVRLGKQKFILCETTLPLIDKIGVIAEALATIGVDVIDLPPVLRARIHGTRATPMPKPRLVLKGIVKVRKTG